MTRHAYIGKGEQGNPNFALDNLTRHCVIVGSTGSGKTGLGISILESCLLNGIPIIAIDPKGDIGNLLYMPTEFGSEEFKAFDGSNAMDIPAIHEALAQATKDCHREWGLPHHLGERILGTTDIRLYTPGVGDTGMVLGLFGGENLPNSGLERLNEASALASSLLSILGLKSGPTGDHKVLLERAIWACWEGNKSATPELISSYLEVGDDLYKHDTKLLQKRLETLSNSFAFKKWQSKPTLDVGKLFRNGGGVPCCSILNTVQLLPEEQQFFLGILFSKILTWVKTQPASHELKALLYIDECQGLIPAISNPVTKQLLLTLIKQARAFGLGIVLSTQNPGDIDYKALSNVGTWITGLLKTDLDRKKVSQAINLADREIISTLKKREFLYSDTFSGEETIRFKSRQTLCYLKGPMDQKEIQRVTGWRRLDNRLTELAFSLGVEEHASVFDEWYPRHHFCPNKNELVQQRMVDNLKWQLVDMAQVVKGVVA
jgi:hypothetical protein